MFSRLRQSFRNWVRRRATESGTVTLNQRRIYILPTKQGFGFAFVLVLMLLGDINYNLSLGYMLTFLLATTGGITMLHAFRNMAQLQFHAGHIDPVFAGEDAQLVIHCHNPSPLARHAIVMHDDAGHRTTFDLPPQRSVAIKLAVPSQQRGWLKVERLVLYTEFPLGLFHAWAYLYFDLRALVYPRPAAAQPLPAASAHNGSGKAQARGDEDFAGLRNYVAGDSLPRIAWKALAREQGLQVKQFSAAQGYELWLDWAQMPHGMAIEQRLELLTRWVLDAEAHGLHYGLKLPGCELPPRLGPAHQAECLHALALFGMEA